MRAHVHRRARRTPATHCGPLPAPPDQAPIEAHARAQRRLRRGRRAAAATESAAARSVTRGSRPGLRLRRALHGGVRPAHRVAGHPRGGRAQAALPAHAPAVDQRPGDARRGSDGDARRVEGLGGGCRRWRAPRRGGRRRRDPRGPSRQARARRPSRRQGEGRG